MAMILFRLQSRPSVLLAHELGIARSAEGIEWAEAAKLVASFGCDQMQGYSIGVPELVEPFACRLQRA
jgi:EAL domain-containing protein (putative c-di-GMP-specific phosphodiesterase class I)